MNIRTTSLFLILFWLAATQVGMADFIVSQGGASFDEVVGGVRFRSFGNTGGEEVYLGGSNLGDGNGRVAQQYRWTSPSATPVVFSFDADLSRIFAQVGTNPQLDYGIDVTGLNLNLMEISVADRTAGAPVNFNNVTLNGQAVGDFGGTGNWSFWTVSNFDFSQDWTLEGDIVLAGTFSQSAERSKVEIRFGGTPIPEPGSLALVFPGLALLARRRRK